MIDTKKKTYVHWITGIFSMIFAVLSVLQGKIIFTGSITQGLEVNTFEAFSTMDILHVVLRFIIVGLILTFLSRCLEWLGRFVAVPEMGVMECSKGKMDRTHSKQLFWCVAIVVFVIDIVYLLSSYPGSVLPDSFSSVYQATGEWKLSNHHPIMFTLLLRLFIRIGMHFGSVSRGIFLFCIFQILLFSVSEGYLVTWLYRKGIKIWLVILTAVFYCGNTIFHIYSIMVQKDAIFALGLLWMTIFLAETELHEAGNFQQKRAVIGLIGLLFVVAFFRNNGLMLDWAIVVVLFFKYRKKIKKSVMACVVSVLILFSVIQGPIYNAWGVSTESAEALSVPLQQIGYVASTGGQINDNCREFLEHILPMEKWSSNYQPFLVDSIKWDSEFNDVYLKENMGTFLRVWGSILKHNFPGYVKAYLMDTYGFWSFGTHHTYGFADNYVQTDNHYGIVQRDLIAEKVGRRFFFGTTAYFPDAGSLFWIFLAGMYMCMVIKKTKILPYLPCLFAWGTIMIATPVAFSLRYVFIIALGVPIFLLWPFIRKSVDLG